jgi:hypothetical protein
MSRKQINKPLSRVLAVSRSVEKRMVRMRRPWAVSNPVRRTTAAAPPLGVSRCGPEEASRTFVPPNKTCSLSCCTSIALAVSGASGLPPAQRVTHVSVSFVLLVCTVNFHACISNRALHHQGSRGAARQKHAEPVCFQKGSRPPLHPRVHPDCHLERERASPYRVCTIQ